MMRSISPDKLKDMPKRKRLAWWSIVIWLAVWQAVAMALDQPIILASPVQVAVTLLALGGTGDFYSAVLFSLSRIALGFLLATAAGVVLAASSYASSVVEQLVEPMMRVVRSIPVASFIIIVLVWISSRSLSIVISFLIVLPIMYVNTLEGIRQTDPKLLEMAQVFRVRRSQSIRYIYVPGVFPYFKSACAVSLGMAWKSGVAAEVIGMPLGSMGERLYQSKIFLDTPSLMAWTVAIVLVSYLFEKAVLLLLDLAQRRVQR